MYNIVTIERKYASGGNEIGKRLAEALGYKLYDRNILMEAAKNLQIPHFQISGLDERSPGGWLFNLSKTSLGYPVVGPVSWSSCSLGSASPNPP